MTKEVKLDCPMCKDEFITARRDKIWCCRSCSDEFTAIKEKIEDNWRTQKRMINEDVFHYDIDSNKFFFKPLMSRNKLN